MTIMDLVTWVLLKLFLLTAHAFSQDVPVNRTSKLYNPIVQLVNFPNYPCTGSSTR